VLDEVQSLPSGLLDPILDTLQGLRASYGTTLLLTTATQPSLHRRSVGGWPEAKPWLDPAPTEIVPAAELPGLFAALERIRVEWPTEESPVEWPALAERIVDDEQALAIVHRRADARALWMEVEALTPGAIHLSALMCPAHRREVLEDVRGRLREGAACRVVSTQIIEAGVDVDFPVVFRAMAGFEALAQSAGRCNREGKLDDLGRFVIYNAPTSPPGLLKHHLDVARIMRNTMPDLSFTAVDTFRTYFDQLYSTQTTDSQGIQALREGLKFEEVARTFQMIDEASTTVFVPWGKAGRRAISDLRFAGPGRERFRALQPFGVAVYPHALRKLQDQGLVEQIHDSAWCLISESSYHPVFGLDLEPETFQPIVV
jgi:CRISPR-associated endonuclease/helicase Cas3